MTLNEILLVCAALLPAVALGAYIFIKDRAEKEPIGLLLLLLVLGAVSCIPAAWIEGVLIGVIEGIFYPAIQYDQAGNLWYEGVGTLRAYLFAENFIGIALVEEGLKFAILWLVTRKNKNFNSLFDGIVYAVFVSLGFAAFENVLYVLNYGWTTAIMRALMSVPGHTFFGVLMGYYYTMWHMYEKAKEQEQNLKRLGLIAPGAAEFSGQKQLIMSLLVPVAVHGAYDYACSRGNWIATVLLYGLVIFLYFYCFGKVRKVSKVDTADSNFASALVLQKHPYLGIGYTPAPYVPQTPYAPQGSYQDPGQPM